MLQIISEMSPTQVAKLYERGFITKQTFVDEMMRRGNHTKWTVEQIVFNIDIRNQENMIADMVMNVRHWG